MTSCRFYPLDTLKEYRYSVILARQNKRFLWCRQKGKSTWEIPGGHIEPGENPLDAAKRELFEETGALVFSLHPLFDYWAGDEKGGAGGVVFLAEIQTLGPLPDSEIEEIRLSDEIPGEWSWPAIQPKIWARLKEALKVEKLDAKEYSALEQYMLLCMKDSAHDGEHVYRVLYNALGIAESYPQANLKILIAACLLHDIGREKQYFDPKVCHAQAGAQMALAYLLERGWDDEQAEEVSRCIASHRYRKEQEPESLEAKILFDADKLDAAGAMGLARTLLYQGIVHTPLYSLLPSGEIMDGSGEEPPSFFHEYRFKLQKLYGRFYTRRAMEIAEQRRQTAEEFYQSLLKEVREGREGRFILEDYFGER